MKLSIIIPTHNRADILKTCLEKLVAQQGVDFEVIVVDDGSTDSTESEMSNFQCPISNSNCKDFIYIRQKASHQAVARNRGVQASTGDIIVFIGDDIFVEPEFLMKHHDRHTEYPDENIVVLGHTTWDPALPINAYMRFLEDSGWQFGYRFLNPGMIGRAEPYKFFYTSNISLKRSFFEKEKFNEDFVFYGWEDIELGYRLWKKYGMRIYYEPQAIAYHHHLIEPSDLSVKMRSIGKSARHFQELQPDVQIIPRGLKALILKLSTNRWTLPLFRLGGKRLYYQLKSWRAFYLGLKE